MDPSYNHINSADPQGFAEAALGLAGYQQNVHQQYMQDPQQYQQQQQQYAQQYQQQMQQHYAQSQNQHYQPQQQQQPPSSQAQQQQYMPQPPTQQNTVSNPVGNGRLPPGRPKGALGKKGKKAKDPNRPKRPTSAYFFFIASKREEARMRGQQISKVAEWTKQVSAIWREMGPHEKKEFDDMAVADKKRFETQMQAYSGKRPKDANRPKRPQSAYFCFLGDFRAKKKSEFTGEGSHKELIRAAGEAWNGLGPAEKIPYEHMAELEKQKYEEAMKVYNAHTAPIPKETEGTMKPKLKLVDIIQLLNPGGLPKKPKVDQINSNPQQPTHMPQHYNSMAATAPIENEDDDDDDDDEEDEDDE